MQMHASIREVNASTVTLHSTLAAFQPPLQYMASGKLYNLTPTKLSGNTFTAMVMALGYIMAC